MRPLPYIKRESRESEVLPFVAVCYWLFKGGQPLQCVEFFRVTKSCFSHGVAKPFHRAVINNAVDRIRMTILSAVREAEASRIAHARGRSIDDVGNQCERPHRLRAHSRNREQI